MDWSFLLLQNDDDSERFEEAGTVGLSKRAVGMWLVLVTAVIAGVGFVVVVGGWWAERSHVSGAAAQARYWVVATLTTTGIAGIGWVVVQYLERLSLRNVSQLIHWIDDVESGHWDALPVPDSTAWGALAYALNRMARRLSQEEQKRHQFLASVAHELKTPLTVLRGNLEGLAIGDLMPTPERWSALHREVTRLTRLVNDLLWLERVQGMTPPLQRSFYRPNEQMDALILRFRPLAESQAITLSVEAEDMPPLWADADRIEQVLINILDNALRHTPAGGIVRIRLILDTCQVCWHIEDSGPGISPSLRNHVREPFIRDPRSPGAGLGLAVADAWIRAHGGRLHIDASPLGGASVYACMPGS